MHPRVFITLVFPFLLTITAFSQEKPHDSIPRVPKRDTLEPKKRDTVERKKRDTIDRKKKDGPAKKSNPKDSSDKKAKHKEPKSSPIKPYKEVIPDSAISKKGLFTVHKVDDKYFFELADSIFGKEILIVTRFVKAPPDKKTYGGEIVSQQTVSWEKGPDKNIFLRLITDINVADSTNTIYRAVRNSNVNPIGASFDIKAYGKNKKSVVIDVTDFFKGDQQLVSVSSYKRKDMGIGGLIGDRSYIASIRTYPINTEIRTVKTFSSTPGLPGSSDVGVMTLELNNSFLLLPKTPMQKRLFDPRVGYFADGYTVYKDDQQKVEAQTFIVRWRMEPKDKDRKKWERGELVEPKKPLVYYIDPATPKEWRPYLIAGINDWEKAFEGAGFKHAIIGKEWPENDTTMSMEDARYSVLRYFASDVKNAYGPNVNDPRSGEIMESHVGWYHNVMKLVHDWYMVQAAAVDPKARKMKFDTKLMGQLIRFVSSHEIGHTLGLRHNMGASNTVPVENLRNKKWVEAHGHTPSIMDYARFNYVAQPEDHISESGLFPRIGEYDKWAIRWGYSYSGAKTVEEDKKIMNRWIIDNLSKNPHLWFGGEGYGSDPRAESEDLGDNVMKSGEYGIKNLKRILIALPEWTKEEADQYGNLEDMYGQVFAQFTLYMRHAVRYVGGIEENLKSIEQPGDVYRPTPKAMQKEAVAFLSAQLFTTPTWLINKNLLNKFSLPYEEKNTVAGLQEGFIKRLISAPTIGSLIASSERYSEANVYTASEFLRDMHQAIWGELKQGQPIDFYRRAMQKVYVQALITAISPAAGKGDGASTSDAIALMRAHLTELQEEINKAIPGVSDAMSKAHLEYLASNIKAALDPKG